MTLALGIFSNNNPDPDPNDPRVGNGPDLGDPNSPLYGPTGGPTVRMPAGGAASGGGTGGSGVGGTGTGGRSGGSGSNGGTAAGGGAAGNQASGAMMNGGQAIDPLVLDLAGSGLNLTALSSSSTLFDYTGDGFANRTGWVSEGTALLVYNPSSTTVSNTGQLLTSFEQLGIFDANGDGVIDASDPEFENLMVWVGSSTSGIANGTGVLVGLAELGITSINLNFTASSQVLQGNTVSAISTVTLASGATRQIAAVDFAYSNYVTTPDSAVTISADAAVLPNVLGAGTLYDLRSAMTSDSTLEQMVVSFAASDNVDPAVIESSVQAIIYQWAGVSSINPLSRGSYADARQLEFLERYLGQSFTFDGNGNPDPGLKAGGDVTQAWTGVYDALLTRLVLQSAVAATILPEFTYDATTDIVSTIGNFTLALTLAFNRLGAPDFTNWNQWHLELRAADAARLDQNISQTDYQKIVSAATSDTVGSLANAIAFGMALTVAPDGLFSEVGTPSNDLLYAGQGITTLNGNGGGANRWTPGVSGDTFSYNAGDGAVNISETDPFGGSPSNVIIFGSGIVASSLKAAASFDGTSLILSDGIVGDAITVSDMLSISDGGIQFLQFADGMTLSAAQLIQMETAGTPGSNTLAGSTGADVLDGKGGNDIEIGNGGNDTFVFNAGYGTLEINEFDTSSNPESVLQLGEGISANSLVVTASADNSSLVLADGVSGDQITIDNMLGSRDYGIEQVRFADGTTLSAAQLVQMETIGTTSNDTFVGTSGADVFDGKGGNDVEIGNGGNDTFVFSQGYGKLEVNEFGYYISPVLELGGVINASSLTVHATADRTGLLITDGIPGDQITVDNMLSSVWSGVQSVQLADGTTMSRQQLIALETTGTIGADTLVGTSGDELFDGKGGTDYEVGNAGNDTFVFNEGYGNLTVDERQGGNTVLQLGSGVVASSLRVSIDSSSNYDMTITDGISGDQITLLGEAYPYGGASGVQDIRFADGSTMTRQQLINLSTTGTSGNDTLSGTSGSDVFDGKGGNDVEIGNGGSDTFVFNQEYGQLEVNDLGYYTTPVLQLGAGITESSLSVHATADQTGLIIADGTPGDQITIDNMLSSVWAGVQMVQFADGTMMTRQQLIQMETTGTVGNDTLYGSTDSDVFDGKGGNDVEIGNGGSDTFVFNQGYGQLEINDFGYFTTPVLQLGAGVTETSLVVRQTTDGTGLVLTDGTAGDQVTIDQTLASNWAGVQTVQFADGTTLTSQQLIAMSHQFNGTAGSDTLSGTSGADIFDGKGGNDVEAGAGGNDNYVLQSGYGPLAIENGVSSNNAANGTLSILNESADSIWLKQVGSDLQLDVMGTNTEATIRGWFANGYNQLGAITTTDSTGVNSTLDSQLNQLVQAMATYSAQNPGFDPTSSANPSITDQSLLAIVSSSYHH